MTRTIQEVMSKSTEVEVKIPVPARRLLDLLVTALEGGSNYWYTIPQDRIRYAEGLTLADFEPNGKCALGGDYHPLELIPFTPGCALPIRDKMAVPDIEYAEEATEPLWLDLEAIHRGTQAMAMKHPRHFYDFIQESEDACTADVWLQCCLFGEAVYG
jgi:hypothetical protein